MENLLGVYSPEEFLRSEEQAVKAYVEVFREGQQLFPDGGHELK